MRLAIASNHHVVAYESCFTQENHNFEVDKFEIRNYLVY